MKRPDTGRRPDGFQREGVGLDLTAVGSGDRYWAGLAYLDVGFRVLPTWPPAMFGPACRCPKGSKCKTPGKHPIGTLVRRGLHDATDDPKTLRSWRVRLTRDLANIAIATGKVSGIVVLDIDGPIGERSLAHLEARYGPLDKTWVVRTRRGLHLYFRYPEGAERIDNAHIAGGENIDVRGDGGMVIAPPSTHAGADDRDEYTWEKAIGSRPPALPAPWIAMLLARESKVPASPGKQAHAPLVSGDPSWPGDLTTVPVNVRVERAEKLLRAAPPAISGQGGHTVTFSICAAIVRGLLLDEAQAVQLVKKYWNPRCQPPWSDADLGRKAHEARINGRGQPGYLLVGRRGAHLEALLLAEMCATAAPEEWSDRAGKTRQKVLFAAIRLLERAGKVKGALSVRDLELESGTSRKPVQEAIDVLVSTGWFRPIRASGRARAFAIKVPRRLRGSRLSTGKSSSIYHGRSQDSPTQDVAKLPQSRKPLFPQVTYGEDDNCLNSRMGYSTLREDAPAGSLVLEFEREHGTMGAWGRRFGRLLDLLWRYQRGLTVAQMVDQGLGHRATCFRNVGALVRDHRIVCRRGTVYTLVTRSRSDLCQHLKRIQEEAGVLERSDRMKVRIGRERKGFEQELDKLEPAVLRSLRAKNGKTRLTAADVAERIQAGSPKLVEATLRRLVEKKVVKKTHTRPRRKGVRSRVVYSLAAPARSTVWAGRDSSGKHDPIDRNREPRGLSKSARGMPRQEYITTPPSRLPKRAATGGEPREEECLDLSQL